MALPFLTRVRMLAQRFLLITIVVIGALCGVLAVLFHRFVEIATELLIGRSLSQPEPWRSISVVATPTIVFVLLALAIRRWAPETIGANLARVRIAYNSDPAILGPRTVIATFLANPISLGAGAPLGPEGPTIVVASGTSASIGRLLHLPRQLVRGLIPVGVAAGIGAVFNAPITGVVFALEEVVGSAPRGLLGGVIVGAVSAAVVEHALLGGRALLEAPLATWSSAREMIGFAVIGILAGVTSGWTIALTHRLRKWWTSVMPSLVQRALIAGLCIGALGLIAPPILGVGYDSATLWLHGNGTAGSTALAFGVKSLAFVIALSAGIFGGAFAPSLFIGTALGAAIGHSMRWLLPAEGIDPSTYAIVGMGSSFAGLLRCPIAAVLIAVEVTHSYELMVPLMLAVSLSVLISRRISRLSVTEQQMIDEGHGEKRESADPLGGVLVSEAMTARTITLSPTMTFLQAARVARHNIYPVVDDEGTLLGIVPRVAIDQAEPSAEVHTRMESPLFLAIATEPLTDLVRRMHMNGIDRAPVVESEHSKRLAGFISPSDILRARMRRPVEEEQAFEMFE